jgi:hypothetical protein
MGSQRLGAKRIRRVARSTGLEIVRAWAHGGYTFDFVTTDHRHGWWDSKTGDWGWLEGIRLTHYTSCHELFPQDFDAAQNERILRHLAAIAAQNP